MIYNITSTEDYASSQVLQLIKNGNKYRVELYNRETKKLASSSLENREQAISIYKKFVDFMIRGLYSFEQRKDILEKNGEYYGN